jgi:two-component system response regulator HydG
MGEVVPFKVLVVEDDDEVARAVSGKLVSDGHEVDVFGDPQGVIARLDAHLADWDVVVVDVGLPGIGGLEVLRSFRESGSSAAVIVLTGDCTASTATACMRAGAFYHLTKPFEAFQLSSMVVSAARYARLHRRLGAASSGVTLVGQSAPMRRMRDALERLADQDVSILIQGESGTGKELVARALHERGGRRTARFVTLNCAAIPESLIDSELFGHVRGAFAGATTDRPGVFVEADGGTLLLDEIADMPLPVQARLVRAIEEGEVRPVGGSAARKVDVRLIAATDIDLGTAVEQGRFRADLYSRLAVVSQRLPPLRERTGDLPLLAAHFLKKHGSPTPPAFTADALELLVEYSWPGNVRELENAVLHAIALRRGQDLGPEALPMLIGRARGSSSQISGLSGLAGPGDDLGASLTDAKRRAASEFEKRYLRRVMEKARGSVSEAARLSGLDRTNFRRLLQRHGLDPAAFKA